MLERPASTSTSHNAVHGQGAIEPIARSQVFLCDKALFSNELRRSAISSGAAVVFFLQFWPEFPPRAGWCARLYVIGGHAPRPAASASPPALLTSSLRPAPAGPGYLKPAEGRHRGGHTMKKVNDRFPVSRRVRLGNAAFLIAILMNLVMPADWLERSALSDSSVPTTPDRSVLNAAGALLNSNASWESAAFGANERRSMSEPRGVLAACFSQPLHRGRDECEHWIGVFDEPALGGVVEVRTATGTKGYLIIMSLRSLGDGVAIPCIARDNLEAQGVLIGPTGACPVLLDMLPRAVEIGLAPLYVATPVAPGQSIVDGVIAHNGTAGITAIDEIEAHRSHRETRGAGEADGDMVGYVPPNTYCQMHCPSHASSFCGPEPACNPRPQGSGYQACTAAARCRWTRCIWAGCVDHELCVCEWYQRLCRRYYDRFGRWPPNYWAPGAPLCNGAASAVACTAAWVVDVAECLPLCW
jgi:hypothetical protein